MAKIVIFTLFAMLYMVPICFVISLNSSIDESALLAFKSQISSDPNDILAMNWTRGTCFCDWIGITCGSMNQRVTGINLANMGIGGTIAKEIGKLSFLESIVISNNNFHGFIPEEMGNLSQLVEIEMQHNELRGLVPANFGFLGKLEKLNLRGNGLTGYIPGRIFNLSSLVEINFRNNSLSGSLPIDICKNLPKLESLRISVNQIGGRIPPSLGSCGKLKILSLSFNDFSGSIPMEIGNLSTLQILYLNKNNLIGNMPSTIFNISSLLNISVENNKISGKFPDDPCNRAAMFENLELHNNQFHGEIPSSLSRCNALKLLTLSKNGFTGSIPNGIGNLSALHRLVLSYNYLTGSIPHSIGNISSLESFTIHDNSISGQIPQELGRLLNLKGLYFSLNKLEGEIPESIFNLSKLQQLAVLLNDISGNLPLSLACGLPDLEGLYLGGNRLSGVIPSSISNFSKLSILELSNNSFSGKVPMNLGNLRNLQLLGLSSNRLTNDPSMQELGFLVSLKNCRYLKNIKINNNFFDGMLPRSLGMGNLSVSLERIYASSCGIKGRIPNEIGNLSNLILLEIGVNDLTGTIPVILGQLNKIQVLGISGNKLQGTIPINFCNLENLYVLNLAENELSQHLPGCLGNVTSLREIYLAYNAFTSTIPLNLWNNNEIQILSLSHNLLIGPLPLEIGSSMKSLRILDLSDNQFSGDIPSTIGKLQSLINLTLSNNRLHGPIPESIGNLTELQFLDLSQNNLSGVIPKSLESLEYLVYFNVSFNKLSGEIPNGGPFKNLTRDSFTGNGELCGASHSLFKVMPCKDNTSKMKSSSKARNLKYILPSCALVASIVIISVWLVRRNTNKSHPGQSSFSIAFTVKRISYYELLKATKNFDGENLIGKGGMGSIFKAIFSNGVVAAVKVFNLDVEGAFDSFDAECQILCNVRHRNLVKVISSCSNQDFKALVLEYMPNGNLYDWLYSSPNCLDIVQRLEIMIDVASALEYLHHGYPVPVVHCDLKPSNILLDENMVAHVGDFGIAKLFTEDQRISRTKTLGTIGYMAPEYGSTGLISTMVDVYSYGILLMETFTKKKPTNDMFDGELTMRRWILESIPDKIMQIVDVDMLNRDGENIKAKERYLKSIMQLALECTVDYPEERLNMEHVVIRLKKIKTEVFSSISKTE